MKKVSFIGLGVMGYPMAGFCAKAGFSTTVYNRTPSKAQQWVSDYEGSAQATIAEAVADADIVLFCVGNDDDIRRVCTGNEGIIANMKPGGIIVDHTTASADVAIEMYELAAERDIAFIDAPISGGQAGAESGQLAVMAGGDAAALEQATPIIDCYAKVLHHMGPIGSGQRTKMVNQICIAGLVQALSEALNFSERAGLDTKQVLQVISKGAAQSWQMENRGETMVDGKFDYGFAVEWMRKDLGLCLSEANRVGARLPVTALVDQFYQQVMLRGGERWDTSSLIQLLQDDKAS